jgi:hypothetical protein
MCVDEAGQNNHTTRINDTVGNAGQFVRRTDLFDHIIADQERAIAKLAPRGVHRQEYVGMLEE